MRLKAGKTYNVRLLPVEALSSASNLPHPMNVLRFTDLCAQGKVSGQRVFIRADLNVPQDDTGRITEDTRIRASVPCIRAALDAGAAWYFWQRGILGTIVSGTATMLVLRLGLGW